MPVIAVDFDGTVTEDVPTFRRVICHFLNAGWTVLICTGRNNSPGNVAEVGQALQGIPIPVVYAGDVPKREACQKAGYKVNVWIDDCPAMIGKPVPLIGQREDFTVAGMILDERLRQNEQWGGLEHDDQHCESDWLEFIQKQVHLAYTTTPGSEPYWKRMVKIAALAIAGTEAIYRRNCGGNEWPNHWFHDPQKSEREKSLEHLLKRGLALVEDQQDVPMSKNYLSWADEVIAAGVVVPT